jgi:sec-independent protein translocase protein TatA
MRSLGGSEIVILLLVVLLLFGAKRLPDAARGLGRSLRILKAEARGLNDDKSAEETNAPDGRDSSTR